MLLDEFAVALLKACFEAWVTCSKKGQKEVRRSDIERSDVKHEEEVERFKSEIAELRSELKEAQRESAVNLTKVKTLESQLATEQEWNFEAERFCQRQHREQREQWEQRMPKALELEKRLEQVMMERDHAMVEREQLRLELTALQLVKQAREDRAQSPPRLQRAELAAVTRQLQDCFIGLAPTQPVP